MPADALAESRADVREAVRLYYDPPQVTDSSEDDYLQACARSNQKASLKEPLTRQFQAEKLPALPDEDTITDDLNQKYASSQSLLRRIAHLSDADFEQAIYEGSINRLRTRSQGAFVSEAGNYAAVTCWEPRFAPRPPKSWQEYTDLGSCVDPAQNFPDRPLFTYFLARIEQAKRKHLYPVLWKNAEYSSSDYLWRPSCPYTRRLLIYTAGDADRDPRLLYWKLCMTSRNPSVQPPVPGAVRAVIEPYVKRWIHEDGMPAIWLEAGGPRARDVYSWLGFRVVDEIAMGTDKDGEPIITWCMIYTKDRAYEDAISDPSKTGILFSPQT